jgi:hypothetical protein
MPPKQNQLSLLDIAGLRKQRQLYLQGNPQLDSGADMFAESGGYSKDAFADQFGMNQSQTDRLQARISSKLWHDNEVDW